jgi:hypothetical protein
MVVFTEKNLAQIAVHGSNEALVRRQLGYFESGFPYMQLTAAATPTDGIKIFTDQQLAHYVSLFDEAKSTLNLLKFVPASGAASRMFKSLFAALEEGKNDSSVVAFFEQISKFAFYDELAQKANMADEKSVLTTLLADTAMAYGSLPKGLLSFHKYTDNELRTPAEEHLTEGAHYANTGKTVRLHFTVSPEHLPKFERLILLKKAAYETKYNAVFEVDFSTQKPSTDTIAANADNSPFCEADGSLLFRPAGHGALLENLNDIQADVVFVKNIDNIVPDRLKTETYTYKKALAGLLLSQQTQVFGYLEVLRTGSPTLSELDEMALYLQKNLGTKLPVHFYDLSHQEQCKWLAGRLDRPMRVCGMVRNQGEPGGGPFWCADADGVVSLQIVESAQVATQNAAQKEIFTQSTHFNPVDLVLSAKRYDGSYFDLRHYTDPATGFITEKSKDGKVLKAQELPGLWNGSMAHWLTSFVEVPLITFNPVKTVNDLLREEHQ